MLYKLFTIVQKKQNIYSCVKFYTKQKQLFTNKFDQIKTPININIIHVVKNNQQQEASGKIRLIYGKGCKTNKKYLNHKNFCTYNYYSCDKL